MTQSSYPAVIEKVTTEVLEIIKGVPKSISFEDLITQHMTEPGAMASILCGLATKRLIYSPRLAYFKATRYAYHSSPTTAREEE